MVCSAILVRFVTEYFWDNFHLPCPLSYLVHLVSPPPPTLISYAFDGSGKVRSQKSLDNPKSKIQNHLTEKSIFARGLMYPHHRELTRQTSQLRYQEPLFAHLYQFDQAFLPIEFYLLYGFDREQFVHLCPETDKQPE